MAKKKRIKTQAQKDYDREQNRIKRFIREATKRGYDFPDNIIPIKPSRISARSVAKLHEITPQTLYKKATYRDPVSGYITTGSQGRTIERKRSAQKAAYTRERNYTAKLIQKSKEADRRIKAFLDQEANKSQSISTPNTETKADTIPQPKLPPMPKGVDSEEYNKILTNVFDEPVYTDDYFITSADEDDDNVSYNHTDTPSTDINDYNVNDLPKDSNIIINNLTEQIGERFGNTFSNTPFNDIPLDDALTQLEDWTPSPQWSPGLAQAKEHDRNVLSNILQGAIQSQGREAVARRLEENSDRINNLISEILYGSGSAEGNFKDGRTQVNADLTVFSSIILGRSLNLEESIALTEDGETYEVNN